MKMTKQLLKLVDKTAAEMQEELIDTIATDSRRPWFNLFRVKLVDFLIKTKRLKQ